MRQGLHLIAGELQRQTTLPNAAEIAASEAAATRNDRIATAVAYLGRASAGVHRNVREQQDALANLIKAGAVIVAAIEAETE